MDRAQDIGQHDLTVDPGEMVAEEGTDDPGLVGVVAPLHLAPEAAAGGGGGLRQGGEGQDRRAGEVAGQKEAAGGDIDAARVARGGEVGGEAVGKLARPGFVQRKGAVLGPGVGEVGGGLGAFPEPVEGGVGPLAVALV